MSEKVLEIKLHHALNEFLLDYKAVHDDINIPTARKIIKESIRFYKGKKEQNAPYLKALQNQWYDSLAPLYSPKPDDSIYDDQYYFTDLWACWNVYSRNYIKAILKNETHYKLSLAKLFGPVKTIFDLGCGIGYTTSALKQIFPNAKVFGVNLESTKQYEFCKIVSEKYGWNLISEETMFTNNADTHDLIVALEYFEHIESAIDHLDKLITEFRPKFWFIANSFNTKSVGHFTEYTSTKISTPEEHDQPLVQEITHNQSIISRKFNDCLRDKGYEKIKTNLWNQKPTVWKKRELDI
jgi:SAM-dependent methyltransferase